MIQDAAYEALLPSNARRLHARTAEVLLSDFAELAEDNPEILAFHYSRAEMMEEARDAWREAASRAALRSATGETIRHLRAAIAANSTAREEGRDIAEIELRKQLNVALDRRAFGSEEFRENLDRLQSLLDSTNQAATSSADQFLSLHGVFGTQLLLGQPAKALSYCPQMSEIASESKDVTMLTLAEHNLGMAQFMLGDFSDALEHFDLALKHRARCDTDELFRLHASDTRLVDHAMRAWALALQWGGSDDVLNALLVCAREVRADEHEFSRCFGLGILAAAYQAIDDAPGALAHAQEALAISDTTEFDYWTAWSNIVAGWAEARLDATDASVTRLQDGLDAYRNTGSRQIILYALALLADAHLSCGGAIAAKAAIAEVRRLEAEYSVRFQSRLTEKVEVGIRQVKT